MRKLIMSCAAAGSLLLGVAGVAASQGAAEATATAQMACSTSYTFANGICNMGQAPAGQQYEGTLDSSPPPGVSGTFFVVSGTVPPGTMVAPSGEAGTFLGGTPTTAGTYTFTVAGTRYLDNSSITPMTYQLTIVGNFQPPSVTIDNSSPLPSATFGTNYTNVFNVSGGSIPYTWSVVSGQLPPGMLLESDITMSQTGDDLTGSPQATGTFTFTMQVVDGAGNKATKQFSLTVLPLAPPPPPPPGHHGH